MIVLETNNQRRGLGPVKEQQKRRKYIHATEADVNTQETFF